MRQFELSPNCSLTTRSAAFFYASIVATSMIVAGGFAAAGYWPILPFAGLELLALGAALYWSMRQGRNRELIRVDDRLVTVQRYPGGEQDEIEFARHWTRVELVPAGSRHWPSRLMLRSRGRSVEIGSFLTDSERLGLKKRLAEVIGSE